MGGYVATFMLATIVVLMVTMALLVIVFLASIRCCRLFNLKTVYCFLPRQSHCGYDDPSEPSADTKDPDSHTSDSCTNPDNCTHNDTQRFCYA
ncbi:hypothetical protein MRX96_055548 [Rhipicephalus microplus]